MTNIVVLDGRALNPGDLSWDGFEKLGKLSVYDQTLSDQTIERIGDAEIVITNKTSITKEVLDAAPLIKYIGILATGYNVVDLDAARDKGIIVTNIPAYSTAAVAQFAIGLLLEICHNIGHHSRVVYSGRWEANGEFCFWDYPQIELAGKTLGIIGFGRIGQATAKIATAIGMEILAHSRTETDEGRKAGKYVTLDELLAKSDVVSLHCPLTPATQGIIDRASIAKMKDGAILINTSRGLLVNERDLADALNSGKIMAAAVDVVSQEPIRGDNPLLKAKNCFITPHIAWAPRETRARLMDIAVENLAGFLAGALVNVLN
ncbi:MAG: D-2-hydroxyacid dehydrogenase [Treponema sp.]|nr:D-2-hydroxyacid dehydrogenase [Treponema sp.]